MNPLWEVVGGKTPTREVISVTVLDLINKLLKFPPEAKACAVYLCRKCFSPVALLNQA